MNHFLFKSRAGSPSRAQCTTWWRTFLTFRLCLAALSLNSYPLLPRMSWSVRSWWSSAHRRVKKSCTATATGPDAPRWRWWRGQAASEHSWIHLWPLIVHPVSLLEATLLPCTRDPVKLPGLKWSVLHDGLYNLRLSFKQENIILTEF